MFQRDLKKKNIYEKKQQQEEKIVELIKHKN